VDGGGVDVGVGLEVEVPDPLVPREPGCFDAAGGPSPVPVVALGQEQFGEEPPVGELFLRPGGPAPGGRCDAACDAPSGPRAACHRSEASPGPASGPPPRCGAYAAAAPRTPTPPARCAGAHHDAPPGPGSTGPPGGHRGGSPRTTPRATTPSRAPSAAVRRSCRPTHQSRATYLQNATPRVSEDGATFDRHPTPPATEVGPDNSVTVEPPKPDRARTA
jgi:hypothetical protein